MEPPTITSVPPPAAPMVSVIVPFYSQIAWLREAIDSVLAQTYTDYEIILVDDGSKEDLSAFLEEYGGKLRYVRQENGGAGKARNTGIDNARGKYLAFLDSDDIWRNDKLELQIDYLEKSGEEWCMSAYTKFGDGTGETYVDNTYFQTDLFPLCFYHMHFATPSVVLRRDYVLQRGLRLAESKSMRYGQESVLWLGMIMSGRHGIKVFEEPLVRVRMRGANANRRVVCHLQGKALMLEYIVLYRKGHPELQVPRTAMFLYRWCRIGYKFTQAVFKLIPSKGLEEFLSRVVYLFPYVVFKLKLRSFKKTHASKGSRQM